MQKFYYLGMTIEEEKNKNRQSWKSRKETQTLLRSEQDIYKRQKIAKQTKQNAFKSTHRLVLTNEFKSWVWSSIVDKIF